MVDVRGRRSLILLIGFCRRHSRNRVPFAFIILKRLAMRDKQLRFSRSLAGLVVGIMAKEFAKPFYKSAKWRKCRQSFIAHRISEDGGLCEICHDKTGLIIHHKEKLTPDNIDDPDIALNFDNLMYVCLDCHNKVHFADWQQLNYVFVNGMPSPIKK